MKTIEFIDAIRSEKGLSKQLRAPILEDYTIETNAQGQQKCKGVKELFVEAQKKDGRKGSCLLFKHIAENGTEEDFEKVNVALHFDLSDEKNYRTLINLCIKEGFITKNEATYNLI